MRWLERIDQYEHFLDKANSRLPRVALKTGLLVKIVLGIILAVASSVYGLFHFVATYLK